MQLSVPPADSIRSAVDRVFADPVYEWAFVSDPWRVLREMLERFLQWLERFSEAHPAGRIVLLCVAIGVLGLVLVHLGYVVYRVTRGREASAASREEGAGTRRDERWYLDAARRAGDAGRYAEAISLRFTALVLQLERQRALRFHPSKTPAEYLREARLPDVRQAGLAALTARLYEHVFGGVTCTDSDWRRFDDNAGAVV